MSRILFKDSTQAREDRVQKKQDFPAANSSMEGGSYKSVSASHSWLSDRTWRRASSSQLLGGYMKANSTVRERTPKLMLRNTRLCTCSFCAAFKSPPFPFSAPLGKSVTSEAENRID